MKRKFKRKNEKKHIWVPFLIVLVAAAVLAGAAAVIFRVNTIEYIGDDHYTDEELTDKLFNGKKPNALLYLLVGQRNHKEVPFIQKYEVEIQWPSKMVVTVYEKPVIGYVSYMGCNMYFDKDGTVVESSTRVLSGIPMISGLKFSSIVLGSRLDVGNSEIFGRILELTQAFDKYNITSDKIYFDSQGNVTLTIGEVRVMLGNCDNLTDTLFELKQIMPKLTGRKGTLHMEDFTEDKRSIIFEKE